MTERRDHWFAAALLVGVGVLYVTTMAPGTLFGDPSEYQFIPAVWGIAHPPGYAFYTLLAGLWQRVVRVGSVAFRTNLLAGVVGGWVAAQVYLMTAILGRSLRRQEGRAFPTSAALIAAMAVAVAPDVWQHSIHANAHIVSAAITLTQLHLLVRWAMTGHNRWLFALAFLCGIGVTHHPITIWGLPAYAAFILIQRPNLLKQPRTWVPFVGFGLLGLTPWLYFPLRSPHAPFGPTDMRTWEGFLRHATARGLRVNLFHFGLADQPDRWRVFWTLLRLQYPWPFIALIGVGSAVMVLRRPRFALLWGGFLLGHLGFTLNSVQDVMAYLLHAFAALGVPLGLGAMVTLEAAARLAARRGFTRRQGAAVTTAAMVALWLGATVYTFPRISLRHWREADRFVDGLVARFRGRGEHAAFVSDWEHLTPYFYHTMVGGVRVDGSDLRPVYVTAVTPWPESVFGNLPLGPVYLSGYRREIRTLGFRLRPTGALWRVLEPPALETAAPRTPLHDVWVDGRLELVGYDLPRRQIPQGGVAPLTLYARMPVTTSAILMPVAWLGNVALPWTTDSRRLTPEWLPGEIIVEQYEVYVPYTLPPGRYPLRLGYVDMSSGGTPLTFDDGRPWRLLAEVTVTPNANAGREARVVACSLTDIGHQVALRSARVCAGLRCRRAVWDEPLRLEAGQTFHLTLKWQVLARPRTSFTVFIHLIDADGRPWMGHDYTPLGGAFPSYLWFPKWLEGQRVTDPYRLQLPAEIPPGRYWLEVGMYEMGSVRRIPQFNATGAMTGDRFILGPVEVP